MSNKPYNLYFFSFFYAVLITYVVPWTSIYNGDFADITNYINRIEYLYAGGNEAVHVGIAWLLNEPLWKYIIIAIGYIFDDYRLALYLISIIIVFLYANFLFKRVPYYIGMIFLFNPIFIDLVMAQVRSAFAFALLLLAYDLRSKKWAIVIASASFFIHTSMPLFVLIYFLLKKLNETVDAKKYYLITIFAAFIIAVFIRYGVDILLSLLGDRRAGYDTIIEGASISYSIVWFAIGLIIATFATFKDEKDRIIAGYAITMTSFFFFSSLMGSFAQRFVALTLPLIIISINYLPKHYKQGTYLMLWFYILLLFKYRLANV